MFRVTKRDVPVHGQVIPARKLVLAMIVVEPNAARRVGFKAFAVVFAKFWGYPLLLAGSREQALQMARELLAQNGKAVGLT